MPCLHYLCPLVHAHALYTCSHPSCPLSPAYTLHTHLHLLTPFVPACTCSYLQTTYAYSHLVVPFIPIHIYSHPLMLFMPTCALLYPYLIISSLHMVDNIKQFLMDLLVTFTTIAFLDQFLTHFLTIFRKGIIFARLKTRHSNLCFDKTAHCCQYFVIFVRWLKQEVATICAHLCLLASFLPPSTLCTHSCSLCLFMVFMSSQLQWIGLYPSKHVFLWGNWKEGE